LPGNPVDLEQREGRVHRFKGHAVRLNLAERQASAIRGNGHAPDDPWRQMFEQARSEAPVDTDLIPYWIYEGSVRVERRVPMLPFSREVTRLAWLKRSLTVYRLAFGQPRQDDLLEYLQGLAQAGVTLQDLADLQIRLEPAANKPVSILDESPSDGQWARVGTPSLTKDFAPSCFHSASTGAGNANAAPEGGA
jgi:hypothetical protein